MRTGFLIIIISSLFGCTTAPRHEETGPPSETKREVVPSPLVALVAKVLEESGQSGSLVYRGTCTSSGGMQDSYRLATPPHDTSALQSLQVAFANEPTLKLKQESNLIRIFGGDIRSELLDLRIDQVVFQKELDPYDVVYKLSSLPEVRAFMRAHRMQFITAVGGIHPSPTEGSPRLNGVLKNVAFSDVLDRIAQAFHGVWVYEECAGSQGERRIYIGFHQFSLRSRSQ